MRISKKKKIKVVLAVTNDIATDARVHKTACTLLQSNYDVTVVGRKLKTSQKTLERPYKTKRFLHIFNKNMFFYAEYNIRLFLYLLFSKFDIYTANDLDTLPAVFIASRIRRRPIIYDSHEYFTEVPELQNNTFGKKVWTILEKNIVPKIKFASTVCPSIAKEYKNMYNVHFEVIRNVPLSIKNNNTAHIHTQAYILYQGALNMGRGIELMIEAMQYIDDYKLYIAGSGPVEQDLKQLTQTLNLTNKVLFLGRLDFTALREITKGACLGLSLEENIGKNYYYALPNKLFDYIQNHIPVLVSDFPEMKNIVNNYNVGDILISTERTPKQLAEKIKILCKNIELINKWKENCRLAAQELCWENEQKKVIELYSRAIKSKHIR
ncbi:MAG: glycosyltransferase [Bacteroidales bacterium]